MACALAPLSAQEPSLRFRTHPRPSPSPHRYGPPASRSAARSARGFRGLAETRPSGHPGTARPRMAPVTTSTARRLSAPVSARRCSPRIPSSARSARPTTAARSCCSARQRGLRQGTSRSRHGPPDPATSSQGCPLGRDLAFAPCSALEPRGVVGGDLDSVPTSLDVVLVYSFEHPR